MKYMICQHGETHDSFTIITLKKDDATIVFQKVPALVYDNCGEKYVDDKITASVLQETNAFFVKVDICKFGLVA